MCENRKTKQTIKYSHSIHQIIHQITSIIYKLVFNTLFDAIQALNGLKINKTTLPKTNKLYVEKWTREKRKEKNCWKKKNCEGAVLLLKFFISNSSIAVRERGIRGEHLKS